MNDTNHGNAAGPCARPAVALLHAGALGDLVLTIQLLLATRHVRRDLQIIVASTTNPGDVAAGRPRIVRAALDSLGAHWLFADSVEPPLPHLADFVRDRVVVSALGPPADRPHQRLVELAPRAVYSFDPRARDDWNGHITDQWRVDLERQGLLFDACVYRNRTAEPLYRRAGSQREHGIAILHAASIDHTPASDARWIVIHPGSGGRAKCWPLSCYLDVARQLRSIGQRICFVAGPAEVERWPDTELAALQAEFPLIRAPQPDDLAALLAAAELVIGNDAGPSHLAALLGTPTISIFGPTAAARWRPLGHYARAIQGDPDRGADWGVTPAMIVRKAADALYVPCIADRA